MLRIAVLILLLAAAPASARHSTDLDCSDFSDQPSAQSHLDAHPNDPDGLDADGDGRACDSLPAGSGGGAPASFRGRVVRVVDGDGLVVRRDGGREVTIRLVGIDAPETRKPGTAVGCGGREASAKLRRLAFARRTVRRHGRKVRVRVGRRVGVQSDPTQARYDAHSRFLGYVTTLDRDVDLNREMLVAGWARVFVFENRPFQRHRSYAAAESGARRANRGIWSRCD